MNLEAILPIIDEIVKESLSEKVYIYGRTQKSTTTRVASGRLKNSIKSIIVENKQGIQVVQMQAFGQPMVNTYAYWLINDRQPGTAPSSAIEKWIREKKSFRIRDFKTGQFLPKSEKNIKSAAYVIARSLKKFGYKNKPKNFWEISVEKIENNPQILELIAEATFDDLYQLIEGI
jgi:hypothetical protein